MQVELIVAEVKLRIGGGHEGFGEPSRAVHGEGGHGEAQERIVAGNRVKGDAYTTSGKISLRSF